ncbi:hypothetical protein [Glaciihabitans sp. dw_435]|uniref:hypothetical protein n=1 Tax=Glaciihabitans sp. dw_435 TaxID=2720081 RepID=UPI001BD2E9DD|nr:hypothetical protein [Glaciihabitans sp. dw_435]
MTTDNSDTKTQGTNDSDSGFPEDDRLNSSGAGAEEAVADAIDPDSNDAAVK